MVNEVDRQSFDRDCRMVEAVLEISLLNADFGFMIGSTNVFK